MTHRLAARLHVLLLFTVAGVSVRLQTRPERGQATVEYVALILLVAAVLAAAVTVAGKKNFDLETTITSQLKNAIGKVSGGK